MRVLLSAYSCSPTAGSEPAIGWNWARCIAAEGHEVIVATRAINRKEIEAHCSKNSIVNPRFLFHDLSPLVQKFYKLPFGNYVYYTLWQLTLAKKAASLHRDEHFDRVQHITWGSFRLPSFLGRLGIPFVFGPVAGGEDAPKLLRRGLGARGRLWDWMRRMSNSLLTLNPWVKATYHQATQIVATTKETLLAIPEKYRHKAKVQQAVGISEQNFSGDSGQSDRFSSGATIPGQGIAFEAEPSLRASREPRTKLNLLYVGRLLPWKGLHLGLRALSLLENRGRDVHLTIIGSGSDEKRLKRISAKLGLEDMVTWIRWMPREQLLRRYHEFDLFLFPSLHDSGGMAVLEAMWFGLPVVCFDLGGPGVSVDNTSGRVIATANRSEEQVAEAIAEFLRHTLENPVALTELSAGARRRARSRTWEANVRAMYDESWATLAV